MSGHISTNSLLPDLQLINVKCVLCGMTPNDTEPPPIRGVSCKHNGHGGWLRRLVRHHNSFANITAKTKKTTTNPAYEQQTNTNIAGRAANSRCNRGIARLLIARAV